MGAVWVGMDKDIAMDQGKQRQTWAATAAQRARFDFASFKAQFFFLGYNKNSTLSLCTINALVLIST